MINLDDHKVYVESHKMEMVPLSIVQAAIAEAYNNKKLDDAMDTINQALADMNQSLKDALKDD